jgi:hypothetical protein
MTPVGSLDTFLKQAEGDSPGWEAHATRSGGTTHLLRLDQPDYLAEEISLTAEYWGDRDITISLDSITFADHTFIGPDRSRTVAATNKDLQLRHQFATTLLKRQQEDRAPYLDAIIANPATREDTKRIAQIFKNWLRNFDNNNNGGYSLYGGHPQ